jgi:hypothetical protein
VLSSLNDTHVKSAPPVTVRSPALAAEIAARDPQRAEQPTLVNLFIFTLPFSYLKR